MAFLGEVIKALDNFGQQAGTHIGGAAIEAWRHADAFGQEAGKHIGGAAVETWKHLDSFGQEAGNNIGHAVGHSKDWVVGHPGETAGIIGCVVAAPITIAMTPLALGAAGFTSAGVAAGKDDTSTFSRSTKSC